VSNFDNAYELWTKLEPLIQKEDTVQQSTARKMISKALV